jgi:hypothetical protein
LPISVQPLVFVDDQLTVNCWVPMNTVAGLMEKVAVGAGGGRIVTVIGADVTMGVPTA